MGRITAVHQDEQALLKQLAEADRKAIQAVYDLVLPSVIKWVMENKGSEADARDLFQEALIALYRQLEEGDFHLSCRLKSYLRIVCRNLWLTRIRNRKKMALTPLSDLEPVQLQESMVEKIDDSEKQQLFFRHFDRLNEQCRNILQLFFDKTPLSEIAIRLNLTVAYVKKRKFLCKEKLVESIRNDPAFLELKH